MASGLDDDDATSEAKRAPIEMAAFETEERSCSTLAAGSVGPARNNW